jgi:tetratricopeptide (TPR) repeat protein
MRLYVFAFLSAAILCVGATAQTPSPTPTPDPGSIAMVKEKNAQALKANALITDFNAAIAAKNWAAAEIAASKLVELEPRSEYYGGLAAAQFNAGKYEAAAASFETSVAKAGSWADVKAADVATRRRLGWALANEGNAYLKLKRNDDALKAYMRSAELAPEPGLAYFNLCATEYDLGNMDEALGACSKTISVDPTRADAWFIKGSLLIGNSTTGANGKMIAPAGTREALEKYLELAPNGPHAADVKEMLNFLK